MCANNRNISIFPSIFGTMESIHDEFLRLLFLHPHDKSEEFFHLTGQRPQHDQEHVVSKHAAFSASIKRQLGHITTKAVALRTNRNLAPLVPLLRASVQASRSPPPRPRTTPFPS